MKKRYIDDMQWTDKIRQVKLFLVVAAVLIAVVSLVVSHFLIRDLKQEERHKMEIWAEAMRSLSNADETTDLNLVLKVINENHTIPVIVLDRHGNVQIFRNIEVDLKINVDSLEQAKQLGLRLRENKRFIRIDLNNDGMKNDYIEVCYDDSLMLKRLATYPYVQLGVVLIFVVVAIFALLTSKRAEQNKVWVGLSKETAHQLGTPISSLLAWSAMLNEAYPDDMLIPEMEKDVRRLELIADRFSKIGSAPTLEQANLNNVVQQVVDYMGIRTSKRIAIASHFVDNEEIIIKLNTALFEWVIENLCKNAVDAMAGVDGKIDIRVEKQLLKVVVEISDSGKGIKKKDLKNVFKPGFTTKKRGWGLGLSLAKRIVEEYHQGKIWVKTSEIGKGTTFRIELPR